MQVGFSKHWRNSALNLHITYDFFIFTNSSSDCNLFSSVSKFLLFKHKFFHFLSEFLIFQLEIFNFQLLKDFPTWYLLLFSRSSICVLKYKHTYYIYISFPTLSCHFMFTCILYLNASRSGRYMFFYPSLSLLVSPSLFYSFI